METKMENNKKRPAGFSRTAKIIAMAGSFLCAVLIWLYAIGYDAKIYTEDFHGIEVVIRGEDELASRRGYTLSEAFYCSPISVKAQGARSTLNNLSKDDFVAVVDVSNIDKAGDSIVEVYVDSPNGIEVIWQSTQTVKVNADEYTQQIKAVEIDLGSYTLPQGVSFVFANSNPAYVNVSGPNSVLETIAGAYVSFNLDGEQLDNQIGNYGNIELRDAQGKVIKHPYVTLSQETAYVTVNVKKQKTVQLKPYFTGGLFTAEELGYPAFAPQSITVSWIAGETTEPDDIILFPIDESAIERVQTFEFFIDDYLPENVINESKISKASITVTVPEFISRSYTIPIERISVKNLPDNYIYTLKNDVKVTIRALKNAATDVDYDPFEEFDPSLMTAVLDFDNLDPNLDGSFTANAEIVLGNYPNLMVLAKDYPVTFTISPISEPDVDNGEIPEAPAE